MLEQEQLAGQTQTSAGIVDKRSCVVPTSDTVVTACVATKVEPPATVVSPALLDPPALVEPPAIVEPTAIVEPPTVVETFVNASDAVVPETVESIDVALSANAVVVESDEVTLSETVVNASDAVVPETVESINVTLSGTDVVAK